MDDLALLSELEPEAERLLNRHLDSAEDWYPHDYVPWDRAQRLLTDGFSYGETELPEGVRSALLVNLACLVESLRGEHGRSVGLQKKDVTQSSCATTSP